MATVSSILNQKKLLGTIFYSQDSDFCEVNIISVWQNDTLIIGLKVSLKKFLCILLQVLLTIEHSIDPNNKKLAIN